MFEGYTNKTVVKEYLKKVLLPITKQGQVIIMDNAGFHKGDDIEELIESKNCKLKYLPSYSPDLNPIEKKWAQIKAWYRKLTHKYEDKTELILFPITLSLRERTKIKDFSDTNIPLKVGIGIRL